MSNFKVGDKVIRKPRIDNRIFERHQGVFDYYTITGASTGGHWLQLDNFTDGGRDYYPWYAINFELYQEPGDELPPVPSSVSYLNTKRDPGNDQRLVLERDSETDEGLLYIGVVPRKNSTGAEQEIGINMSTDAALQLAHDLNRMANEIKRKQKSKA